MKITKMTIIFFWTIAIMLFCQKILISETSIKDEKSQKILSLVDAKIADIKSYVKDTAIYVDNKLYAESTTYYKASNRYKEVTRIFGNEPIESGESIKINDGAYTWNYIPFIKSVTKEKSNDTPIRFSKILSKDKDGIYTKLDYVNEDKNHYIFEGIKWHEDPQIFSQQNFKVFFRKDTGLINEMIFYNNEDRAEMHMIANYRDINKPLDDNFFVFEIPKDIIVTDLDMEQTSTKMISVKIDGARKLPSKVLTKNEIYIETDEMARILGFDIKNSERQIKKINGIWVVSYYNKSVLPHNRKVIFWLDKYGQHLKMERPLNE